jgi:hypothetical protein
MYVAIYKHELLNVNTSPSKLNLGYTMLQNIATHIMLIIMIKLARAVNWNIWNDNYRIEEWIIRVD